MNIVFSAVQGQYAEAMARKQQIVADASMGAIKEVADKVKREGRANIAAAGFSKKWQNALRVNVYPTSGSSINAAAYVFHNIGYAGVFEKGATIQGSPLLWIPLPTCPKKVGRRRVTAGNYQELIGSPLHTIRVPGKRPMLGAYVTAPPKGGKAASVSSLRAGARNARRAQANAAFGGRASRFRVVSLPLFVGIPAVTLRARFSLSAIFERARAELGAAYLRHLKDD